MCLYPKTIVRKIGNVRRELVVPCGHCIECNHRKRRQIAVECYRTCIRYEDVYFVTFTYRDESLPISFRFSDNNGEIVDVEPFFGCCREDFARGFIPIVVQKTGEIDNFRELYFSQPYEVWTSRDGKKHRIHKRYDLPYLDSCGLNISLCPSLDRKNWRLSIKRGRVRYLRNHCQPLPDFKYIMCGEYSPVCHRPHYHALFFGLNYSQLKELVQDWRDVYGFAQIKKVKNLKKGQDGRLAVSMYVGKYIVKGNCEYEEVCNGMVEKPRRCVSKEFGFLYDLEPNLIAHHLAYDICPYDPEHPLRELNNMDRLFSVLYTIYKRLYYGIQNKRFTLPDGVKRELFYQKVVHEDEVTKEKSVKFVPYEIWRLVACFIRNRLFEEFENAIREKVRQSNSEISLREITSFCSDYENQRHDFSWALQKDYDDFLRKVAIK